MKAKKATSSPVAKPKAKAAESKSPRSTSSWTKFIILSSLAVLVVAAMIPIVFHRQTAEYLNNGDWGWVPLYSDIIVAKWCWSMEDHIDHVDGPIYIGNVCAATDLDLLQRENITFILNTCLRCPTRFGPAQDIKTLHLKLKDIPEQDIFAELEGALAFINEAVASGSKILIHCAGGKSRSATFVVAYLIRSRQWTYDQALEFLRTKRAIVRPNPGFEVQLRKFEAMEAVRRSSAI